MSHPTENISDISQSRRNIILGANAVAATNSLGFSTKVNAEMEHKHIHHGIPRPGGRQKIIDTTLQCIEMGSPVFSFVLICSK